MISFSEDEIDLLKIAVNNMVAEQVNQAVILEHQKRSELSAQMLDFVDKLTNLRTKLDDYQLELENEKLR